MTEAIDSSTAAPLDPATALALRKYNTRIFVVAAIALIREFRDELAHRMDVDATLDCLERVRGWTRDACDLPWWARAEGIMSWVTCGSRCPVGFGCEIAVGFRERPFAVSKQWTVNQAVNHVFGSRWDADAAIRRRRYRVGSDAIGAERARAPRGVLSHQAYLKAHPQDPKSIAPHHWHGCLSKEDAAAMRSELCQLRVVQLSAFEALSIQADFGSSTHRMREVWWGLRRFERRYGVEYGEGEVILFPMRAQHARRGPALPSESVQRVVK